ncbi:MAG: nitroreductase family protein [Candidatus Brockarchaeota archaeon]|nr:nitroreductase family protein [Candidatus Brockarchaeota archaeon]
MDALEAIAARRSRRSYAPTPVEKGKIAQILEAARLAPSAANAQPWHFVVVTDPRKRKSLSEGGIFAKFLSDSPVVVVCCGDKEASPKWHLVDTSLAMQNMVIAATALGLGTCIVGSFDEGQVRKLLRIPERFAVVALLAIGYALEKRDLAADLLHLFRRRKELQNIASAEEFGKPYLSENGPNGGAKR